MNDVPVDDRAVLLSDSLVPVNFDVFDLAQFLIETRIHVLVQRMKIFMPRS